MTTVNISLGATTASVEIRVPAIEDALDELGVEMKAVRKALSVQADQLTLILAKEKDIMATQAEFQTKIDSINANTTASAAAAQAVAKNDSDLKTKLDGILTNAGVPADQEAEILAQLDLSIGTSTALKTFLESTAAGPVTGTEPPAVTPPVLPAEAP